MSTATSLGAVPVPVRRGLLAEALPIGMFLIFAVLPLAAMMEGSSYLVSLGARIMIFAIAAVALDVLVGCAGLISFGHAAFIGLGAYAVGILSAHGIADALIALPAALLVSALYAFLTGIVCLRTKGVYFIMITLAFGQMAFFTASSLAPYGGDDGLTHAARSPVFRCSRTSAPSTMSCCSVSSPPISFAVGSSPRASAACCAARRKT